MDKRITNILQFGRYYISEYVAAHTKVSVLSLIHHPITNGLRLTPLDALEYSLQQLEPDCPMFSSEAQFNAAYLEFLTNIETDHAPQHYQIYAERQVAEGYLTPMQAEEYTL